jgi:hypothetical protein
MPQSERRLELLLRGLMAKNKTQTHQLRNEAQLNCAFCFVPSSIRKGRRELSTIEMNTLRAALDNSPRQSRGGYWTSGTNKESRHVGLDFYDLLIEAHHMSG